MYAETRLTARDARVYDLLGDLSLAESSYIEAQAAFAASVRITREQGPYFRAGVAPAGLSYAACRLGQLPQARQYLAEALTSTLPFKADVPAVYALSGVALYLAATGDTVRAIEVWTLARRHPFVANSKWFEDVVGRELEALAASLPPKMAEAARARGQVLDLWEAAADLLTYLQQEVKADSNPLLIHKT
jgi:tetratricopeptide (TPR) repeat protein